MVSASPLRGACISHLEYHEACQEYEELLHQFKQQQRFREMKNRGPGHIIVVVVPKIRVPSWHP